MTRPRTEIWGEGGHWRWAYSEDGLRLLANQVYETREAALEASRLAYPGVEADDVGGESSSPGSGRRPGFLTFLLAVVAVWRWYRRAQA